MKRKLAKLKAGITAMIEGTTSDYDARYRKKLIAGGVPAKNIKDLSGHDLNCVGNLFDIYRDELGMEKQNPRHFAIMKEAARRVL
jgi:hypothetical protein